MLRQNLGAESECCKEQCNSNINLISMKEDSMPNVKLVVIYPRPKDVEAFEKVYQN